MLEGAVLFSAVAAASVKLAGPPAGRQIVEGLAAAWVASTAGACALILARPVSAKAFWLAFGGGMALRAAVFAGLMWRLWGAPPPRQGAVLGAYALGVLGFLLVEYRNV